MAFNEKLPEWNATGVEPPTSKKNEGWQPDDKPPADWFNWLFNRAYKVLDEIRTILGGHVDAAAPHSGHETPAGATAKASAAETNAKNYTDTHAGAKDTHGAGAGYYIAKTSRSDQLPAYADVQGKPPSFPPSTHTHPKSEISDFPTSMPPSSHKSTHASGGSDALSPADIGAATAAQGETADTAASDLATHLADTAINDVHELKNKRMLKRNTVNQSIANDTETDLIFPVAIEDTTGGRITFVDDKTFVIGEGVTLVRLFTQVIWHGISANGYRHTKIGSFADTRLPAGVDVYGNRDAHCIIYTRPVLVNKGDTFTVQVKQTSGGALNIFGSLCYFGIEVIE